MITLMVTSAQAQALHLVMEHGNISLVMRNPLDTDVAVDVGPTSLSGLTRRDSRSDLTKEFTNPGNILKSIQAVIARTKELAQAEQEGADAANAPDGEGGQVDPSGGSVAEEGQGSPKVPVAGQRSPQVSETGHQLRAPGAGQGPSELAKGSQRHPRPSGGSRGQSAQKTTGDSDISSRAPVASAPPPPPPQWVMEIWRAGKRQKESFQLPMPSDGAHDTSENQAE